MEMKFEPCWRLYASQSSRAAIFATAYARFVSSSGPESSASSLIGCSASLG
jgi:hypothetical protein